MKSLKKIIETLIVEKERIEEHISKREDYVLERSEKWQESEKCEHYEERTFELEDALDSLDRAIEELESWINEN